MHKLVKHRVDVAGLGQRDGPVLPVAADLDVDERARILNQILALEPLPVVRPELVCEIAAAAGDQDHEVIHPDAHLDIDHLGPDGDRYNPDVGVNRLFPALLPYLRVALVLEEPA